jgi:hypothetical protein
MKAVDVFVVAAILVTLPVAFAGLAYLTQARLRRDGYRWRRVPRRRPSHIFRPESSSRLRGGVITWWFRMPWPFATLAIDDSWARVVCLPLLVWVPRSAVSEVRVATGLIGPRIRFVSDTGDFDGLIFWTRSTRPLRQILIRHGWPVNAEPPPDTGRTQMPTS